MSKILTISIAAYNSEDYIRKTLNSLIVPDYIQELEVFVIDDGGTDGTLDIAKEYQKKYPDTFIPVHKQNGGYGSTVNYSIENATGKYFKLLDGDDWFDTYQFKKLIEVLKQSDCDVLVTDFYQGTEDSDMKVIKTHVQEDGTVIDLREGFPEKHSFEMWELVYKTEVLRKSGLKLPEHELYTDRFYTMIPFAFADKVQFSDLSVYCYRLGRDGQSMSIESQLKHFEERIRGSIMMAEFYSAQKKLGNPRCEYLLMQAVERHTAAASLIRFLPKSKESLNKLQRYEKKIKSISKDIVNNERKVGQFGKLLTVLRHTGYLPYWLIPDKVLKKKQSLRRKI